MSLRAILRRMVKGAKAMLGVYDVATYFLFLADQDEDEMMTNMKLQKLLYYAQGFHLAIRGEPLFREAIEAWIHGPVVPAIYHAFKGFGRNPIPFEGMTVNLDEIEPETKEVLDEVYQVYGQFSAIGLRNLTHNEPPWKNTPTGATITRAALKSYFDTQVVDDGEA